MSTQHLYPREVVHNETDDVTRSAATITRPWLTVPPLFVCVFVFVSLSKGLGACLPIVALMMMANTGDCDYDDVY